MTNILTEDEKNNLVTDHKGIIFHMANKFRFVDPDIEEVQGWCYLGMAIAIDIYEKDRTEDFASIAFLEIKKAIYEYYYRGNRPNNETSIEAPMHTRSDDGEALTLEDISSADNFYYDIKSIIEETLFEERTGKKEIVMAYLVEEKTADEIADEVGVPTARISRTIRRGRYLLRLHLSNNDIISDYLLYPSGEYKLKKHKYKALTKYDQGRIKYIRMFHPYLKMNDIAKIINTDPYSVSSLMDYPTTSYLRVIPDGTIKDEVEEYSKVKYPERLPGEVKVYEMA